MKNLDATTNRKNWIMNQLIEIENFNESSKIPNPYKNCLLSDSDFIDLNNNKEKVKL